MKKTYNFSLLILLVSTLSTTVLLSDASNRPESITEGQEHLDKLRKEKKASEDWGTFFKEVDKKRLEGERVKIAADLAMYQVEEHSDEFAKLDVDVRTAMIERHPGRFTRVLYAHPNLIRSFPARKVAKDVALEVCAPIIAPIVWLYVLIKLANDTPEPESPEDKLEDAEETKA